MASLEGKFAIPTSEMVEKLNALLSSEYTAWLTYTHFGFILKGPYRDTVKKILDEHAEQELEHANKLAMRISALGGSPTTKMGEIPKATTLEEILAALVKQEQEALKMYRDALRFCGKNEGLRQNLETIIEDEQEHSDELSLMSPGAEAESGEKVAAYLCAKLDNGLPVWVAGSDAIARFASSVADEKWGEAVADFHAIAKAVRARKLRRLGEDGQYEVTILDDNDLRTVYDVSSKSPEGELTSVCRVVKEKGGEEDSWAETCSPSGGGSHILAVKQWEASGGGSSVKDDPHYKNVLDTLKGKGKKPFHKNVTHKPLPKLTKPETVKKPLQRGVNTEPQIQVEDKKQ
jgi:bacterioferritin